MNSVFVRPDVQAFLDYVNTARPAKHFELGPEKARTIMRDMRVLADVPVGELAVEQDLHCPGPGGEIRLRQIGERRVREGVVRTVKFGVSAVYLKKKKTSKKRIE